MASEKRRRGASWVDVAWLMLSDVVGTSVLTFGGVANNLGSLPTTILIVGLFPMSLFVSVLMTRTRVLVGDASEALGDTVGMVDTMGEMSRFLFQSRAAGGVVYFAVYGYTLLGQASYLLVLGKSVQSVFYKSEMCIYTGVALSCVLMLAPIVGVRSLGESVLLCFVNMLLIAVVIVIALGTIASHGSTSCTEPALVAPGLDVMQVMGAATNVVYSFAGQWMYFEIMETMETPGNFPKAFILSGPFMVCTYLAVALVSHHLGVQKGDIVEAMPLGAWSQAANFLLFAHVVIVYLIKSVVLQQFFHRRCSPGDVDSRTPASYAKHGAFGAAMLAFGFVVADAVPFLYQLLGLLGGFLGGPINFVLPMCLYLLALGRFGQEAGSEAPMCPTEHDSSSAATEDEGTDAESQESSSLALETSSFRAVLDGLCQVGKAELFIMAFILVFISMTMILGVSEILGEIAEKNESDPPFSCHALNVTEREMNFGSDCEARALDKPMYSFMYRHR